MSTSPTSQSGARLNPLPRWANTEASIAA
jgi:hypothetical protein